MRDDLAPAETQPLAGTAKDRRATNDEFKHHEVMRAEVMRLSEARQTLGGKSIIAWLKFACLVAHGWLPATV